MSELFSEQYSPITWRMMLVWLAQYFVYYGITLLMPTVIQSMFHHSTASGNGF